MTNINFKDNCWDKCEELHKRFLLKNTYMGNILEIFSKLQIALRDFSKSINNLIIKDYPLFPEKLTTQNEAIEYIKYILAIQTTQFNISMEIIKTRIIGPLSIKKEENFRKEKGLFYEFKKIENKYNDILLNMKKAKDKYYQSANIAEMSTKSTKEVSLRQIDTDPVQQNLKNIIEKKSIDFLIEAKKNQDKYVELVDEANKCRENYIKNQYELLNFYDEIEKNDASTYKDFLLDFLSHLKTENSILKENLIEMEEKINLINLNKDMQTLIPKYSSDKKPDLPIIYEYYQPKIDIKNCAKDEDYKLYYEIVVTMKNYLNILPEFDIQLETKKQELRELCKIFFSLNVAYDDNLREKLISYFQEEWSHNLFLAILSRQRTKGRYCRTKKLIDDLAIILNFLVDLSHKSLSYEKAKACIILSQTFYYENNNTKIYIYHSLKNNKWLITVDFWRNLINVMIENEIENRKEKSEEKLKKTNIENIVFSQVLSYTSSMKDFQIDERLVIKIIDEFMQKYNVSKEISSMIYNNFGDEKYIEKLRNEYQSMPDLEQRIADSINKEKNNEKKEEQKKELVKNEDQKNKEKGNKTQKEKEKNNIIITNNEEDEEEEEEEEEEEDEDEEDDKNKNNIKNENEIINEDKKDNIINIKNNKIIINEKGIKENIVFNIEKDEKEEMEKKINEE